jgi:hypothetical protein
MRTKIEDLEPVFRIRIRMIRIRMFLGFPDLDPLETEVRFRIRSPAPDTDLSIIKKK